MNNSRKKKIAQEIAAIEKQDDLSFSDKEAKIMALIHKYNITINDMLELDEIIMNILKK